MTSQKHESHQSDLLGARKAIVRAALQARKRAQRFGIKIAIWADEQVQYVSPETCSNASSKSRSSS